MTDLDITALKEALAKMTPGEWLCRESGPCWEMWSEPLARWVAYAAKPVADDQRPALYPTKSESEANAAGIVLLRNSADAMIARIEALEAENARLRNIVIDAMEIIEDQLPGEFSDWENRAYNAINYGAA